MSSNYLYNKWKNTKFLDKQDKRIVYNFLSTLRESGITNMFGAHQYMGMTSDDMQRVLYGMKKDPEHLLTMAEDAEFEDDMDEAERLREKSELMQKLIDQSEDSRDALIRGAMKMCENVEQFGDDDEETDQYMNCVNQKYRLLIREMFNFYMGIGQV